MDGTTSLNTEKTLSDGGPRYDSFLEHFEWQRDYFRRGLGCRRGFAMCARQLQVAASLCPHCKKPIGFDREYVARGETYWHAGCAEG